MSVESRGSFKNNLARSHTNNQVEKRVKKKKNAGIKKEIETGIKFVVYISKDINILFYAYSLEFRDDEIDIISQSY